MNDFTGETMTDKIIVCMFIAMIVFPIISVSDDIRDINTEPSAIQVFDPEITLFQSVVHVKKYIKENSLSFKDCYLQSITLQYIEEYPEEGYCWYYSWHRCRPTLGGGISLYHYMDGSIYIQHHGP